MACFPPALCVTEYIDRNAAELAGLILEAVHVYGDHKLERLVISAARTAAFRSDAFVKALAAGVVKAAAGLSKPGGWVGDG